MKRVFLLVMLTLPVFCQADVKVYGIGGRPCSAFVEAANNARRGDTVMVDLFMHWFGGFATLASVEWRQDVLFGKGISDMQFELEVYCRSNPDERFLIAASEVTRGRAAREQ